MNARIPGSNSSSGSSLSAPALRSESSAGPLEHAVFWQQAPTEPAQPALSSDVDADVCIVGGGFTGLWTAHFLKQQEPKLRIRVLEARLAGGAASGTADGFVTPTLGKDLAQVAELHGAPAALQACRAVGRSILEIGRFCRRNSVDAEYEPNDYLMVASDTVQLRRLEADAELSRRLGLKSEVVLLDGSQVRRVIGSPILVGGMRIGGALVQPFKLARGLARVVREQGVVLNENSPVLGVERQASGRQRVRTPHGSVNAEHVVLATSAAQHKLPGFARKSIPVWSYALVSEPLTAAQRDRVHWPGREGLVESRTFLHCGRFTGDSRILWAGGRVEYFLGGDMAQSRMAQSRIYGELQREFLRYFPMWNDVQFRFAYGGCIDITRDLVPHFGRLAPGIVYGYGYCGNGIAASHLGGKVLCDLVLGRDSEYTNLFFVNGAEPKFPPEPLTFAGVRWMTRAMELSERLQ